MDNLTKDIICDRLETWELCDFIQVPMEEFLEACEEFSWINKDNLEDVLEFVGLRKEDDDVSDES